MDFACTDTVEVNNQNPLEQNSHYPSKGTALFSLLGWSYWIINLVCLVPVFAQLGSLDTSNPKRIFWPFISACLGTSIARIFLGFHYASQPQSTHPAAIILRSNILSKAFVTAVMGLAIVTWTLGLLNFDKSFTFYSLLLVILMIVTPMMFRNRVVWDCFAETLSLCLRIETTEAAIEMRMPLQLKVAIYFGLLAWALLQLFVNRIKDPVAPKAVYDYHQEDFVIYLCSGVAASFASLVVGILSVTVIETKLVYRTPEFLIISFVCYFMWKIRLWIFANRGIIESDPISFCLGDPLSYLAWLLIAVGNYWATR